MCPVCGDALVRRLDVSVRTWWCRYCGGPWTPAELEAIEADRAFLEELDYA